MQFSDTGIVIGLAIVATVVAAALLYIKYGGRRNRTGYDWKPEQDYDVIQTGEANMTPAFPVLKRRSPKGSKTD